MYRAMNADYHCYDIHFFDRRVLVTATSDARAAERWVRQIQAYHYRRISRGRLVAGLAAEWRRPGASGPRGREPAAVVQLCVGHHCLIFQLCWCPRVPDGLRGFLADPRISFVGVGLGGLLRRLGRWGLRVANAREVRKMAAARLGEGWSGASIEELAAGVLGYGGVREEEAITCSDWHCRELTPGQVMHACVDAYIAFRLGMAFLRRRQ